MKTRHEVHFADAGNMEVLPAESIDLVVTSPPYPMIEMWDGGFGVLNPKIGSALKKKDGGTAFEGMHRILDTVWREVYRVLKSGGIACVNIGDATRTINENFSLYANHARILTAMLQTGFQALPAILWRKQTNAPNKFMGSGMMPPGAYVTLEHEYILVLRKGRKREFVKAAEKKNRRESAFFWEERNLWFSDVWMDLKGVRQHFFDKKIRHRSAAFPFELAYRLVNMFSVKGDCVLDPFLGVGTTMFAAMAACRNSTGYEIDPNLNGAILAKLDSVTGFSNNRIRDRIKNHVAFVEERFRLKGKFRYFNKHYRFPVITNQETQLLFNQLVSAKAEAENVFEVQYAEKPQKEFVGIWDDFISPKESGKRAKTRAIKRKAQTPRQQALFS